MESVHPVAFVAALILVTVWHELGHMVAARLVNVPVQRISVGLGPVLWRRSLTHETDLVLRALPVGMAIAVPRGRLRGGDYRRPIHHDLWLVVGGPLASFVLTGLLFAAARWGGFSDDGNMALVGIWLLSLLVALLNLLPIPGLDGGHLLQLGLRWLGRPSPSSVPEAKSAAHGRT